MVIKTPDDIKEWLQDIAETNIFSQLRAFSREHPNKPIPPELEFAALYAPIVGENDGSVSFDQELSEQIDAWIADDESRKGGGSYKEWRPEAFIRIGNLIQNDEMSLEAAVDTVLDELTENGIDDHPDNLTRSYHRHALKTLVDQIGTAIADDDNNKAVEFLEELRRRHNTFGICWSA